MAATLRLPKYRRQKMRKRNPLAFVELDGKRHYLGTYGSESSKQEYERLIQEYLAHGRVQEKSSPRTVAILAARYIEWAQQKYRQPDGTMSSQYLNVAGAVKVLVSLYSDVDAAEFGPNALKTVRHALVSKKLCRKTINERIGIIKRLFRKAVEFELIAPEIATRLTMVEGLSRGEALDHEPIRPVEQRLIDGVLPHLSKQIQAVIQLQLLTAARPGELLGLRPCDLDMSDAQLWVLKPAKHKTAYLGREREIYFGPRAQDILRQFIDRPVNLPFFSPIEAEQERREEAHARRVTPLTYGNLPGSNVKPDPVKHPGDSYTIASYRRAISRACVNAFPVPKESTEGMSDDEMKQFKASWRAQHHWHPHQLRHNAATLLRRQYGIETARVILGHSNIATTEIYAEADFGKAKAVIRQIG